MEKFNGLPDPRRSGTKVHKIFLQYVKNKEEDGCINRNFAGTLKSGI